RLPSSIPRFIIDKEGLFNKIIDQVKVLSGSNPDIQFKNHSSFSDNFHLSGEDEDAIRTFFTADLIQFLENNEIHHIESNGEALMIFKYVHIARTDEVRSMLTFSSNLLRSMNL
ncbi:MAG: SulP family inorganic anion transporter, partial [Bacteroidia bacterium]|nr:SulP family inorganic anion transporter [Bacteroidia bacterium]